jgi:hypothetical protein
MHARTAAMRTVAVTRPGFLPARGLGVMQQLLSCASRRRCSSCRIIGPRLPAFNRERVTIDKDNTTIVRRAPEEPIRQIVINVGVEGAVIVMEVKKNKKAAYGFNAATEEYMDMIEAGIIDPTKVTRTALQNAASIADRMITTECLIADKPEDDKKMGGGMGGGNMY